MAGETHLDYPRSDSGLYHLTPKGWLRQDCEPYPRKRLETWRYEMEQPAKDDKQQVRLTRIWITPTMSQHHRDKIRLRFGDAVQPSVDAHIVVDCRE